MTIFFCSDPHGQFAHVIRAVEKHRPAAVVLLGDQETTRPLDMVLAPIVALTKVYWIAETHDTDSEANHDNLFESGLKGRNIEGRVIEVESVTIVGIGGVFRAKAVWDGVKALESYQILNHVRTPYQHSRVTQLAENARRH